MNFDRYDYAEMARSILAFKADAGGSAEKIMELLRCMKAQLVHFKKHDLVAKQGEKARIFGLVIGGALQTTIRTPLGERFLMRVVRPGEYLGHSFLFQDEDAVVPCDVVAWPRCDALVYDLEVTRTFRYDPEFADFFKMVSSHLSRSLVVAWKRGFIISQRTLVDRVMAYLLLRRAESGSSVIMLPGTIEDLANYLACNRAALSRALSKLCDEGKIKMPCRGYIHLLSDGSGLLPKGDGVILPA